MELRVPHRNTTRSAQWALWTAAPSSDHQTLQHIWAPSLMDALELVLLFGTWSKRLGQLKAVISKPAAALVRHTRSPQEQSSSLTNILKSHMHSRSMEILTKTHLFSCIISSMTLKLINLWFLPFLCSPAQNLPELLTPSYPRMYTACSCPFKMCRSKFRTERKRENTSSLWWLSLADAD